MSAETNGAANGADALPDRTFTMVVGALGGEGGGVLTSWIVAAAESLGFPCQSTSIPGVAQRTGATTYYIEIYPAHHDRLEGRSPTMALYATPGNMDVVVTSELMEAGRALELGWVTPDRTTLISSSHRVYSILEKSAMGDGRFEASDLIETANHLAKRAILIDMDRLAQANGTVINAVILGVIAGSGEVPIPAEAFEEAIEKTGVAVSGNLRGFKAGYGYVRGEIPMPEAPPGVERRAPGNVDALLARVEAGFPPETRRILQDGVRRTVDYQNLAYGGRYLDNACEESSPPTRPTAARKRGFRLTIEGGRHLALWMSYEDIIRVAALKSRPERMERVRREVGAKESEPVVVTEFLKPGFDEIASVLPPALGRALTRWKERKPGRQKFHVAMRVKTNTVFGYVRLWGLAKMRFWRPYSYRFAEEWSEIGTWLEALESAAGRSYDLALEIAELPNLRKGYSDTHRRGVGNYRKVFEELARPGLDRHRRPGRRGNRPQRRAHRRPRRPRGRRAQDGAGRAARRRAGKPGAGGGVRAPRYAASRLLRARESLEPSSRASAPAPYRGTPRG